jgi:hypothetical protein
MKGLTVACKEKLHELSLVVRPCPHLVGSRFLTFSENNHSSYIFSLLFDDNPNSEGVFVKLTNSILFILSLVLLPGCASMLTGGDLIEDPNGPTGTLTVVNNAGRDIVNLYVTRCSNSTYGGRRNDKEIGGGEKYSMTVTPGCWTVRIGSDRIGKGEASVNVEAGKEFTLTFKPNGF